MNLPEQEKLSEYCLQHKESLESLEQADVYNQYRFVDPIVRSILQQRKHNFEGTQTDRFSLSQSTRRKSNSRYSNPFSGAQSSRINSSRLNTSPGKALNSVPVQTEPNLAEKNSNKGQNESQRSVGDSIRHWDHDSIRSRVEEVLTEIRSQTKRIIEGDENNPLENNVKLVRNLIDDFQNNKFQSPSRNELSMTKHKANNDSR